MLRRARGPWAVALAVMASSALAASEENVGVFVDHYHCEVTTRLQMLHALDNKYPSNRFLTVSLGHDGDRYV
jgi:hypothetical protein